MPPFPASLDAFERMFPDGALCLEWLIEARWPNGFACPRCGSGGKRLRYRPTSHVCGGCRYEVAATAGTIMHKSRLPLRIRFRAAWLLLHKLRAAMVDPDRTPLASPSAADRDARRRAR